MAIVVGIKVRVEKRAGSSGPNDDCPLVFSYSGNDYSGINVLDTIKHDLHLTKIQEDVLLVFYLAPTTLDWNGVNYRASLAKSLNPSALDALWIWKAVGGTEGPYPVSANPKKDEFHDFKHGIDLNTQPTTEVATKNREREDYYFKLSVYLKDQHGNEVECRDDPQIKNGGLHGILFGLRRQTVVNTVIGLVALAALVRSLFW